MFTERDWMDKQDVMFMLRISDATLRRWRRNKVLSHTKMGGKIYYRRDEIEKKLHSNMVKCD